MSGWRQRFIVGVDAFYACFETFRRHYVALYSLKHKEIHTFHCKKGLVVELELTKKMSKGVFMKKVKIAWERAFTTKMQQLIRTVQYKGKMLAFKVIAIKIYNT